ncbi:hypothetical protein FQA39_LY16763 [Lamprigera yunnana]|nr:hypothetical protein FQA39_LY16763 [Lamprigera yunnana]
MDSLKFNFTVDQLVEKNLVNKVDIDTISAWSLTEQLPQPTDEMIALFLISCDNDKDLAKATVHSYYKIKNGAPEIFNGRDIERPDLQAVLKLGYFCLVPQRTPDGDVVVFVKAKKKVSEEIKWNVRSLLKVICMVLEAAYYDYPPRQFIIIFDVEHITFKQVSKLKPKVLKIFVQYLQEGFPSKLKAIHVVNMVDVLNSLTLLLKPFVKKSVWKMTKFHSKHYNRERFFEKYVPKDYLPEEIGGTSPSAEIINDFTIQRLSEIDDYFRDEELHRQCLQAPHGVDDL